MGRSTLICSLAGIVGISNQNVLPLPAILSTPIFPSIRSTSFRQIERPRPVPPYLRVVELSAWEKDRNNFCLTSGDIPMPVSLISKRSTSPFFGAVRVFVFDVMRSVMLPFSVNFMALPTRLSMIWRKRVGSPITTKGISFSTSVSILTGFPRSLTSIHSMIP